ncbi:hypothetical protein C5167_050373 [Papaver somniferum]|uniref:Uncharacterized protein n=1 Tax=Papaver somniferum TaxID=3469 RepID=A0A4Y7KNI5_PAPSO|nr:hypothetical protein C5167_050373 [Papaver somniferum]
MGFTCCRFKMANVCRAYHILPKGGLEEDHIIVMMFDDIVNHWMNPTHDYTREDVPSRNFFNILMGNRDASAGIGSGKVISSGPNDVGPGV